MREPLPKRAKVVMKVIAILVAFALFLYFFLARFNSVKGFFGNFLSIIAPFLVGALFAFLLKPLCNFLDKKLGDWFTGKVYRKKIQSGKMTAKQAHRKAEAWSIVIAMIFFALVIIGIVMLIIPSLISSIVTLKNDFPGYLAQLNVYMENLAKSDGPIARFVYDAYVKIASIIHNSSGSIIDSLLENYRTLLSTAFQVVSSFLSFLVSILITVVSTVYILINRKRFGAQANLIVRAAFKKPIADWLVKEAQFTNRKFSEYFTGKLLDSFVVGIVLFIVLTIFRIPMAPLIATFMAVCNMIPFFGPYIGAFPCMIIIWMAEPNLARPIHVLIFLIIVVVVQQLDGNILDPYIVGDKIGLSGFWVLFAVVLCGDLFGFMGLLIGVPLFVVIYDLIRQLVLFGLHKRGEDQLVADYNFIYHNPDEERAAKKKRASALREARKKARDAAEAEQQEALERELAIAHAAQEIRGEEEMVRQAAEAARAAETEADLAEPSDGHAPHVEESATSTAPASDKPDDTE